MSAAVVFGCYVWQFNVYVTVLYGLPLLTFSLLRVVTSHLVLEVFARQLLLFGVVLVKLSQRSADT